VGGIIGKLSFDRHVAISHATVQRMIDAVAHRAGRATYGRRAAYVGRGIALGSCHASTAHDGGTLHSQVAQNETGTIRAVADADLSNATSLRCMLEDRGHLIRGSTDAELMAHAYEEWGDACVARFAGPFALAIWDEMRRRLVLARDAVGIRPLCFAFDGRGIVFGSEAGPLLQDPSIGREWQPEAIDAYLARGYVPAPFTVYRRIDKLEPAHILVVEGRRLTTRRYWDVPEGDSTSAAARDATDRLESSLRASVASLGDLSNPCVLMSGGVASTTVAAMLPGRGTGVTIGIEQDASDLDRLLRIEAYLGLRGEIDVALFDPADILRQLASCLDEPAADPAAVSHHAVFAAARRHTDVALTGHGAGRSCDSLQAQPLFDEALRHRLYTRRFACRIVEGTPIARCTGNVLSTMADRELALADRTASLAGLRLRHPFCDRDVATALTNAPRMDALFRVAARYLPAPLLPPARRSQSDPAWLSEAVRSLVPHVLLGERFDTRGIFSRAAVQALWAEHQRGGHDHTRRLWSLLMLEFWAREFIDGDAAAQPAEDAVLVRAA
jgi:asparagine synthetase B (glutamine-hydrolysing)